VLYIVRASGDGCEIFLLTLYDKSEESSISKVSLQELLKKIFGE